MTKDLEKEINEFKGRIDCISKQDSSKKDYKFVRLISKQNKKFIGYAKTIPPYVKKGDTTTVSFIKDLKGDYTIFGWTIP